MRISDWSSDVCSSDLEVGPYADDHGEHHDLDARRHDIAEHTFSEEAGAVPQREWHLDEAGQRGQLELDNRHEHLHREDEERSDERRVGKEFVSTCRSRCLPYHSQKYIFQSLHFYLFICLNSLSLFYYIFFISFIIFLSFFFFILF